MRRHLLVTTVALTACVQEPEPARCADGLVLDGSSCVPARCGTGTWGDLPVDDATFYVDATAGEGGSGTARAPFPAIQEALDAARRCKFSPGKQRNIPVKAWMALPFAFKLN